MSSSTVMQRIILQTALVLISCSAFTYACYGQLLVSGINAEEKKIILQEHNRLRQTVATGRYPGQPGAENMREIIWDDELAARAQKWADNCQFRHDPHRTINRFTMGQNLAIIWSTAPLDPDDGDFPSRIQSWFNEVQKYSFGDAWSPKTGHYSQLVWGETSLVGCGYSEYKDARKYNKLWVCNYGPGGNVVGYNPYEAGKPSCKTYGMRPSQRYNGLCAAPKSDGNGIDSNIIETYEYKQTTNAFNNKQTALTTQIVQQVPSSSSYPQQATSYFAKAHTAATAVPIPVPTSKGGSSYGAAGYGGSTAYTTETSQQQQQRNQYNKYRNKLESYRPTPEEFEKSVQKHTVLRNYLNQAAQQQQLVQQEPVDVRPQEPQTPQQQGDVYYVEQQPQVSTQKPAKRGWSLLTWQG